MPKSIFIFSGLILLAQTHLSQMNADEQTSSTFFNESDVATPQQAVEIPAVPYNPFTGKITRNKVRLRLQPNLDSPIIKELTQNDMLIVIGETEDFYAVQPPTGLKSYVFRTYILDNIVEASRVNVRLEPDLEAPIIAQLYSGDRIEGSISALNSKWLEITPPVSARFYVSKDYLEKIGDPSTMAKIEKQRNDVNILLNTTYLASQTEMQKAFPEINLDPVFANYNKILNDYKNFPEQSSRAKEQLSSLQDNYLQKKISYLEAKTKIVQEDWQSKNSQLSEQMKSQQQKMSTLEQQLKRTKDSAPFIVQNASSDSFISKKMTFWLPIEQALHQQWSQSNESRSLEDFYGEQHLSAVVLKGVLEPYNRIIKNKPGDYILVNPNSHLPIAYLYSTKVNLQDRVGYEVTVYVSPRDNHSFAFPAYFVLSVE